MAQDTTVNLALIGILGTVVATLFKLLMANTKALSKMAESSEKVAAATKKSAKEAETRNGHLAEQTVKIGEIGERQARLTRKIITRLEKTAVIDRDAAEHGGQLVKTKPTNPLAVKRVK